MVDHFAKFTFLKAMKEATATKVVKFLVEDIFNNLVFLKYFALLGTIFILMDRIISLRESRSLF